MHFLLEQCISYRFFLFVMMSFMSTINKWSRKSFPILNRGILPIRYKSNSFFRKTPTTLKLINILDLRHYHSLVWFIQNKSRHVKHVRSIVDKIVDNYRWMKFSSSKNKIVKEGCIGHTCQRFLNLTILTFYWHER